MKQKIILILALILANIGVRAQAYLDDIMLNHSGGTNMHKARPPLKEEFTIFIMQEPEY